MSFSVSGTFGVLALGVLLSVGMVYSTAADGFTEVSDARAENVNDLRERGNTAIDVVDPVLELGSTDGTVRADTYNNGSVALRVNRTDILINGTYIEHDEATIEVCTSTTDCSADRDIWEPSERLHVEVTKAEYLTNNPDRITIVTENGVSDGEGIEVL